MNETNTETETKPKVDPRIERREKLIAGLPGFIGTEHWYDHILGLTYTDGIRFLAETASAYWFLDVIASYQPELRRRVSTFTGEKGIPFQVWRLGVNLAEKSGEVTCHEDWDAEDHTAHPAIVRQELPYTDFPLDEFICYCTDNVILLPGEN